MSNCWHIYFEYKVPIMGLDEAILYSISNNDCREKSLIRTRHKFRFLYFCRVTTDKNIRWHQNLNIPRLQSCSEVYKISGKQHNKIICKGQSLVWRLFYREIITVNNYEKWWLCYVFSVKNLLHNSVLILYDYFQQPISTRVLTLPSM